MSKHEIKFFSMPPNDYIRKSEMGNILNNPMFLDNPKAFFENILDEIHSQIDMFGYNNGTYPDCLYIDCETYVKLKIYERKVMGRMEFNTDKILNLEIKLLPICTEFIKVGYKDMDEMSWFVIKEENRERAW